MYIHELKGWPRFHWSADRIAEPLASVSRRQGLLIGHLRALGIPLQQEAELQTLTADVLKIEGEKLNAEQVRSFVARRLGMDIGALKPADRHVEGVVEMMLDATQNYQQSLTSKRLFRWHVSLFPTGQSGMTKIRIGAWRDDRTGPMQAVSGPMGKERVHLEAPKAQRLDPEMKAFLKWFETGESTDLVLRAGLARSEDSPQRFSSMSAQIRQERNAYYDILERTQQGTMDVTPWMEWFLGCLGRAIDGAQVALTGVLEKARFWDRIKDVKLNGRQRLVINACWMGSKASSRPRNTRLLARAPRIRRIATFWHWSSRASSRRIPEGGAARAIRLLDSGDAARAGLPGNIRQRAGVAEGCGFGGFFAVPADGVAVSAF